MRRTVGGPTLLVLAFATLLPARTVATPRTADGGQSAKPQGQSAKPQGQSAKPQGQSAKPQGQSAQPQGQPANPTQTDPDRPSSDRKRLDKEMLTPAERKLDSHLRDEIARRLRHVAPPLRTGLRRINIDDRDRALVEIRARILTQLRRKIDRLKGSVVSSSVQYRSMIAWVPILKLETLAEEATVSAIGPAPTSTTVRPHGR